MGQAKARGTFQQRKEQAEKDYGKYKDERPSEKDETGNYLFCINNMYGIGKKYRSNAFYRSRNKLYNSK